MDIAGYVTDNITHTSDFADTRIKLLTYKHLYDPPYIYIYRLYKHKFLSMKQAFLFVMCISSSFAFTTWEPLSCARNSYFFLQTLDIDGPLHDYYGVCKTCPLGSGKEETFYKPNAEYVVGEVECKNCTEQNATLCLEANQTQMLTLKTTPNASPRIYSTSINLILILAVVTTGYMYNL
jgi:hypothetical protein